PIFEVLLQNLQDNTFRSTYNTILLNSIQHIKQIIGLDSIHTYLENYLPILKQTYYTYVPQINEQSQIVPLDTDLDDDDDRTPRASQNNTSQLDNSHSLLSNRKPPLPITNDNLDFYSIIDSLRSNWSVADETNRLNYLEH
ncbi:unnamed protein product, partial [Adineta steineri]